MKIATSRSILLSLLAASTSTSSVVKAQLPQPEIVGGEQAERGDYPYFAQMDSCGGALIAADIVLFAAHCGNLEGGQVVIGSFEKDEVTGNEQVRVCVEQIDDPNFQDFGDQIDYDFALCKLDQPVEIDGNITTIEINEEDSFLCDGDELLIMGYGKNGTGIPQSTLQYAAVNYIVTEECNGSDGYDGRVNDTYMFCAGVENGGVDACQGDSGGPIVKRTTTEDGSIVDTHVGIVSFGDGCGSADTPGVYARTSARAEWIKNTMCNDLNSIASFCENGIPSECDENQITILLTTDDAPTDNNWTLTDSDNEIVASQYYYVYNFESERNLCVQAGCYNWTILDSYGDGLCSSFPCKEYIISVDGEVVVQEKFKTGEERVEICTETQEPSVSPTAAPTASALPTASPSTSPTASPSTSPTASPTTSPFFCTNNPDFRKNGKKKKDCDWVAEKPESRCEDDVIVECPRTCNPSCSCTNNPDYMKNENEKKNCDWVAKKPDSRCNDETTIECPRTCNSICRCENNPDYRKNGNEEKNCDWVAENTDSRCNDETTSECPRVCDTSCKCTNSPAYIKNGNVEKTCDWVEKNAESRCDNEATGECPEACNRKC